MMNWTIIGITLFTLAVGVSYLNFTTEQIYQNFPAISNVGNNDLIFSTTYDFQTFGAYMIAGVLDFFFNLSSWFKPTYDLAVSVFATLPSVFEQISADIIEGIFQPIFDLFGTAWGGLIV
jgi:hypothetical protein